jgi:hypothetical protein
MLGKILADTIEPEPVGSDRQRVQVPGNLSLEKLIAREAMNSTSDDGGRKGRRP